MSKTMQNIVLILVVLIVLIPTGVIAKHYTIDRFARLQNEAIVAYSVAALYEEPKETVPTPTPNPTPKTCNRCNGTKKVRSGDGLALIPCECGDGCQCSTKGAAKATEPRQTLLLVTDVLYCGPCITMDRNTIPALKARGWKVEAGGHIEIYDYYKRLDLVHKYGVTETPTWIIVKEGKVLRKYAGYLNGYGVGHFWDGVDLTTEDTKFIPYSGN